MVNSRSRAEGRCATGLCALSALLVTNAEPYRKARVSMEYRLLGPLVVEHRRGPIPIASRRARLVLAALLLHPNMPVAGETLVDVLWADAPPARAAAGLRVVLSRLRSQLEPDRRPGRPSVLTREPGGWRLVVAPGALDTVRFEQGLAGSEQAAAAGDPALTARLARAALAEWRGPALADVIDEFPNARAPAARWEELRLVTTELAVEADIELGRHNAVIGELVTLVGVHPYRERFVNLLMVALYRSGRPVEALRVYDAARRRLMDEIGIEPTAELAGLERAILDHEPGLAPQNGTSRLTVGGGDISAGTDADAVPLTALSQRFAAAGGNRGEHAIGTAVAAAHQSMAAGDLDTAVMQFDRARRLLVLAGRTGGRDHVEVLLALGRARMALGDPVAARDGAREALGRAERGGWSDLWAEAALAFAGELAWMDDDEEVLGLLTRVLTSLPAGHGVLRARLAARRAAAIVAVEGIDAALHPSDEALRLARAEGRPQLIATALHVCLLARQADDPEAKLPLADEAVRCSAGGSDLDTGLALFNRLLVLLETGTAGDVGPAVTAFGHRSRTTRAPIPWFAGLVDTALATARGELAKAEPLALATFELGTATGVRDAAQAFSCQFFMIRWLQGRLGELREAIAEEARRRPDIAGWSAVSALARAEAGDTAEALADLERLLPVIDGGPRDRLWIAAVAFAAEAATLVGPAARDVARRLHGHLHPWAGRHLVIGPSVAILGPTDRYLAGLLQVCGATAVAAQAFERAAAMADRAGFVPYRERAREFPARA
jgi:DNA-binding SARP family transcriptional activator